MSTLTCPRCGSQKVVSTVGFHGFEGMLVGPTDVNMVGRYGIDAETGMLVEGQQIAGAPTWGLALYTGLGAFTGTENAIAPKTFESRCWRSRQIPPNLQLITTPTPNRQSAIDRILLRFFGDLQKFNVI
jgi:hypothetical protein